MNQLLKDLLKAGITITMHEHQDAGGMIDIVLTTKPIDERMQDPNGRNVPAIRSSVRNIPPEEHPYINNFVGEAFHELSGFIADQDTFEPAPGHETKVVRRGLTLFDIINTKTQKTLASGISDEDRAEHMRKLMWHAYDAGIKRARITRPKIGMRSTFGIEEVGGPSNNNNAKVSYGHHEVSIERLLIELYNGTRAVGLGVIHDQPKGLQPWQIQHIVNDIPNKKNFDIDYLFGRPIKLSVFDGKIDDRSVWLYDRDAGKGRFMEAFERARRC